MKCDELKAFNCVESNLQEFCPPRLVYPKPDVDAAIAELKDKLREQTTSSESGWKEAGMYHAHVASKIKELYEKDKQIAELKRMDTYRVFDSEEKELRHQKRKRCLRNAESCMYKAWYYEVHDSNAAKRMWKWQNRWLSLADKFKEEA